MDREGLRGYIAANYADLLTPLENGRHDLWYAFQIGKVVEICRRLRDDETLKFDFLCNIGAIDTGERFEIEYNLTSTSTKLRIDLKTTLPYENAEIDSVQEVWPGANWHEREIWELYGINIRNHNDLRRFLLPDDWDQGFPMRKDWDAPDFIRMPEY
jgi:NADH:ubiquinone oxidoreductase subunit C